MYNISEGAMQRGGALLSQARYSAQQELPGQLFNSLETGIAVFVFGIHARERSAEAPIIREWKTVCIYRVHARVYMWLRAFTTPCRYSQIDASQVVWHEDVSGSKGSERMIRVV